MRLTRYINSSVGILRRLVVALGALAAVAGAEAQTKPLDLSVVGWPAPKEILAYRSPPGMCDSQGGLEDCLYVSPEGVEYSVFDAYVCNISAVRSKVSDALRLPYGLEFGDSKAAATTKVPLAKGEQGGWFKSRGLDVYAGRPEFSADPEALVGLYLSFDAGGRLNEVQAQATCV